MKSHSLALILGCLLVAPAALAGDDALELATKVYNRPDGQDVAQRAVMVLAGDNRETRQREFIMFAKDKGEGERWSMTRFLSPADIEDTGVLTQDHPGDNSDQWLYLPALKRTRRISSSRKGGRFVGSDIYFEDLRDREVDMDSHRLVGQAKVAGLECELLESTPVERSNSVYSKRVSCIHRMTLLPLHVNYYQRGREEPVKKLKVAKIKKVQGYWTVTDSTVEDLEAGSKTRVVVRATRYDQDLPDSLFSKRGLTDSSTELQYRP